MQTISMCFPGGRKKALTLSYDDGVEQDIRLMDIMKKNGLKGTFNINSGDYSPEGTVFEPGRVHRRMTRSACISLYKDSGMEVAVHGLNHPWFDQLPANICTYQVSQDRANLESDFEQVVRGCAYPFGTFNDEVVDILDKNGIVYSRGVDSSHSFDIPKDWLRLRPTCHHADGALPELLDKFLNEKPMGNSWLFYLWGHSYEFEQFDNWNIIESFAKRAGGHEDVWYATNIEIYDYVKAFESLKFSAKADRVQNLSAYDIWFEFNVYGEPAKKQYCVKAGETLKID